FLSSLIAQPTLSTLFPYTTLFRSQFVLLYLTAIFGTLLLKQSLKGVLLTFPFIFVLTLGALLVAGNASVKGFNLEAVIFSLAIRSEEHTSELQSRENLVCRLLLEK